LKDNVEETTKNPNVFQIVGMAQMEQRSVVLWLRLPVDSIFLSASVSHRLFHFFSSISLVPVDFVCSRRFRLSSSIPVFSAIPFRLIDYNSSDQLEDKLMSEMQM
jgi:hypothetical protein